MHLLFVPEKQNFLVHQLTTLFEELQSSAVTVPITVSVLFFPYKLAVLSHLVFWDSISQYKWIIMAQLTEVLLK